MVGARRVLAIVTLFLACSAAAQEFDIFDLNDFIDPRDRGAVFRPEGWGVTNGGNPFGIIRAYTGGVADYQWRNLPTDTNVTFLHLTGSQYWSNKQVNVKLTSFGGPEGANLPRLRGTFQFGYYLTTEQPADEKGVRPPPVAVRYLVTYSIERNSTGDPARSDALQNVNHEFGLEADVQIALPQLTENGPRSVTGSFVFVRRSLGDGNTIDRLTYVHREKEVQLRTVNIATDIGVGGERDPDGWHWGAIRPMFLCTIPIPAMRSNINLTYAPTWVPRTGRRLHHEFALFLDATLFSKLLPRP